MRASGGRGAIAAAAMALLLAGCSSGGSGGGTGGGRFGAPTGAAAVPTSFSAVLAAMPSTSWDGGYVEFGAVAQVNALNGAIGSGPLTTYYGIGESALAGFSQEVESTLGFDPLKAVAAVTVGQLPEQATVLYGSFDVSAVTAKMTAGHFKNKGTAGGGTVWALGADNQANLQNPTADPQLNDIDATANRIVLGPSVADVEALAAPSGPMMSSNSVYSTLANCLSGALAGIISTSSTTPNSPVVGIGLLAPSAQSAGEEICASAADSATATAIGAHFTEQIDSGRSQRLNEPWSKVLVDPQASVVSGSPAAVRLSTRPAGGSHVGVLIESLFAAEPDLTDLISP